MSPVFHSKAYAIEAGAFPKDTGAWMGLDVVLAVTILLILNGLALLFQSPAMFKTQATEVMTTAGYQRRAVMEHFAVTGEWLESDVGLQGDAVGAPRPDERAGDAQDRAMRGELSGARAGAAKGGERAGSRKSTIGVVDGVIVGLGNYAGFDGVALVTLRPSVPEGGEHPVVQWLCGRTPVPAGWRSPPTAVPANLPDHLLFSVCRGSGPR